MTEWPLTVLALVFLLAYSWEVLARTHVSLCETTINVIWIVFIVDYVVSISLAHDRKTWFKNNLLLLISIMLPIFRPLRLLRLDRKSNTSELQSHHDLVCRLLLEKKE